MCKYCDPHSDLCEIYIDLRTHGPYLIVENCHWDSYNEDYIYDCDKIYINYCPYCGRSLTEHEKE